MRKVAEQLIAAKAMINAPSRWCQGAFELDGAICASMAICIATNSTQEAVMDTAAYQTFCEALDIEEVSSFNDHHTHAEVMAAFDKAIEAAR